MENTTNKGVIIEMNPHAKQKVWLEEVMDVVDMNGLEEVQETDKGLELGYDPKEFSITQANEMMALAQRDEMFTDYFVDVSTNKVCFHY